MAEPLPNAQLLKARRYEEERRAAIEAARAQHAAAVAKPDADLAAAKAKVEETRATLDAARKTIGDQASIDAYHLAQNEYRTALHVVDALTRSRKPAGVAFGGPV